jgi:hypothetical protein
MGLYFPRRACVCGRPRARPDAPFAPSAEKPRADKSLPDGSEVRTHTRGFDHDVDSLRFAAWRSSRKRR